MKSLFSICLTLVALLSGCSTPKPAEPARTAETPKAAPVKEYQMRGEVTGLDPSGHVATIKHEEIKGFMGAMTMGYAVKDPAEFGKLSVGEPITATVYVKDDEMWIGNVQKRPSTAAPAK